jgi:hypothetical protein
MTATKHDDDTAAKTIAPSVRATSVQSAETGGHDADTPDAPDFSFVSGAANAPPEKNDKPRRSDREK